MRQKKDNQLVRAAAGWVPVPVAPELVDYRFVMRENYEEELYERRI